MTSGTRSHGKQTQEEHSSSTIGNLAADDHSVDDDKVGKNIYPLVAGFLMLVALTIWGGINYLHVLGDFWAYLSSFGSVLPPAKSGILAIGTVVGAVIAIKLVLVMLAQIPVKIIAGPMRGEHKVDAMLKKIGIPIIGLFVAILFEELFARFLFMGVLDRFLPGNIFIWGLVGNTLWALVHLWNYEEREDRHVVRVLPQFISGLFYMFVFVQFGFFWTLIAHFSFNAMLFGIAKRKNGFTDDISYGLYWGVVAAIAGYFFFSSSAALSIVQGWVVGDFIKMAGAGFWDYFLAIVAISAISEFALSIVGYDVRGTSKEEHVGILGYLISVPIMIGLILLGVFLGEKVGASQLSVVLFITLALTVMTKVDTMSALSRIWFNGLIGTFLIVGAIMTLGFSTSFLLLLAYYPILFIPSIIKREAGKFSYGNGKRK